MDEIGGYAHQYRSSLGGEAGWPANGTHVSLSRMAKFATGPRLTYWRSDVCASSTCVPERTLEGGPWTRWQDGRKSRLITKRPGDSEAT